MGTGTADSATVKNRVLKHCLVVQYKEKSAFIKDVFKNDITTFHGE